jgi:hypothetical protein
VYKNVDYLSERSSSVTIGGVEYPLIVTTRATKEIAKRYGGLEHLGTKLMNAENMEDALSEVVWIITMLANQAILIHNFQNRDNQKGQKTILTEDEIELMTTPADMFGFKAAITEAMIKGTQRTVESEDDGDKEKNPEGE